MRSEPSLPPGTTFNHYGQTARPYWHRWLPQRLTGLDNPEAFFTEPADQAPPSRSPRRTRPSATWRSGHRKIPPHPAAGLRPLSLPGGTPRLPAQGPAPGPDLGDGRGAVRWR
jgi:hypothetical protein